MMMQRDERLEQPASARSLAARLRALWPSSRATQEHKAYLRHYAALQNLFLQADKRRDDVQNLLVAATDACREGLNADRVSIWVSDKSGRLLELQALSEVTDTLAPTKQSLSVDDVAEVLKAVAHGGLIASDSADEAPHLKQLFLAHPGLRRTRSRIDIPILLNGVVVGLIVVSIARKQVKWTLQQIRFAREIGTFVTLAVERRERADSENMLVRLNTSLLALAERREESDRVTRHHQGVLTKLIQSSSNASRPVEDVLQDLTDTVRDTLAIDRVSLWLGSDDRTDCRVVAASDLTQTLPKLGQTFPFPTAPTFVAALETGSPLIADDVSTAPHLKELLSAFPVMAQTKSRIDVPILRDGKLVGMMICVSVAAPRIWSSEDVLFCSAISGVTSILLERHHRQKVESDLRYAHAEVLAANQAKSLFLANMSHEIRTPMNGVFGMTDLLLRTPLTERQARLVSTINQSARTLLTIINDILDLSRIEAGKFELDAHDFDLHTTIEGAVELFVEDAQRKGLDLSLYVAPDVPVSLLGDSGRLRQICINVIGNAVKFTQTGEIAVRLTAEHASPGGAPRIVFEVRDTGIGIPQDVQSRLFRPFAQADSSISRRFGGTGLGLSISMHLAALMGGRLHLTSSEGKGTTVRFEVTLPIGASPTSTEPAHTDLHGARILVVDDRETNREIVTNYLASDGATCEAVADAHQALEAIANAHLLGRPFTGAVIDLIMPGVDGLELIQLLRADPRNAAMGIVMATSLTWKGDQRSARGLGVQALLTKPIRRSDLTRAMAIALATSTRTNETSLERAVDASTPTFKAHVLLAEDNPVNVEVAKEYLAALGLTFDLASDGAEACAAAAKTRYDLVLMDCQMPGVDGLEASRRIRALEAKDGRPRVPIIAVTANAYDSDRLACLEAGMDDYISKPFTEAHLVMCLSKWLIPVQAKPDANSQALDAEFVASLQASRPKLFERIFKAYLAHSPRLISELTEAAATGNVSALQAASHSLKSSSANIGAKRLADLCHSLEASTRGREPRPAVELVRDIAAEYRAVGNAIARETRLQA